jgi:hypothetical protein
MRDMLRAENLIKYKADIESRKKREWFTGKGRRESVKAESKEDLVNIKKKFESHN